MGYRCIHRDIALNAREPATLSSHATVSEDRATPEGRKILDRCGSEFESGVAAAPADQMWCAEKRGSSWRVSASASWPQGQLDIRHSAASSLRGDRPHWSGARPGLPGQRRQTCTRRTTQRPRWSRTRRFSHQQRPWRGATCRGGERCHCASSTPGLVATLPADDTGAAKAVPEHSAPITIPAASAAPRISTN